MKVYYQSLGPVATNAYLIACERTGDCVLIDTPAGSLEFFTNIVKNNQLNVVAIWLTHSHWDHTWDVNAVKEKYNVDVWVHHNDIHRLQNPNNFVGFDLGLLFSPMHYDKFINEGDKLQVGNLNFEVVHTPGHTEGGVCFVNHNEKTVIAGDTLFKLSIGRTDLAGGNYEELIHSIKAKLLILPEDYIVLPGHGEKTSIGYEKKYNQFLI